MYYIAEVDFDEVKNFAYLKDEAQDKENKFYKWGTGKPMLEQGNISGLHAKTSSSNGTELRDMFTNEFGGIIFNERYLNILREIEVNNLEEFPLTIQDSINDKPIVGYSIFNIIGSIACIDRSQSSFSESKVRPGKIKRLKKLTLDMMKINDFNEKLDDKGPIKIFRIEEKLTKVIVHEDVKVAAEKAKLTGWVFTEVSKYKG